MATVEARQISKHFNEVRAVDGIDLSVGEGEFLTLLGPSGCGKTTLMRMIAGLEQPTSGNVVINGREVTDLPPRARNIAMVRATRRAVVSGTMPIPTLHSTRRHTASKLRNCTRSRSGCPMRAALSARKRCSALARSSPTKSWSSTSAKEIFERLKHFPKAKLERVRVEETGNNTFEYSGEEL